LDSFTATVFVVRAATAKLRGREADRRFVARTESLAATLKGFSLLTTSLTGPRPRIRRFAIIKLTRVFVPKAAGDGEPLPPTPPPPGPPAAAETLCGALVCAELPAGFEAITRQR
jgi:hypothetical protein